MVGDLENFDRRLGAKLKELRKRRGLSLADVAFEIGVTYQQLQKHEAGRNSLSIHRMLKIANALALDPHAILDVTASAEGAGELSKFSPLQRLGERHRLVKAYFSLPEETRLAILNLIEVTEGQNRARR